MIVALFANFTKPQAKELAIEVGKYLQKKMVQVVTDDEHAEALSLAPLSSVAADEVNLLISFGGDGSILNVLHAHPHIAAPIMGVNLGTLGFLADITPHTLYQSLDEVLAGNYRVQERQMLAGFKADGKSFFAVNEIVVHRGPNHSLVDICLTVAGKYFNTFSADGVIVATPSGSTAYSLSAGGPIVEPELEALLITPICPHALSNRPIVLGLPSQIEVRYLSHYEPIEVVFDGVRCFTLHPEESFFIQPASRHFKLVSVASFDYFATLRSKLNWTGSLRN